MGTVDEGRGADGFLVLVLVLVWGTVDEGLGAQVFDGDADGNEGCIVGAWIGIDCVGSGDCMVGCMGNWTDGGMVSDGGPNGGDWYICSAPWPMTKPVGGGGIVVRPKNGSYTGA